jgi:ATP-dependent DNA helicase RecQ
LFEKLRALRKQLADERSVPSYIIFSDVSLRQMARLYPTSEKDFARISGVGEKKLHEFGAVFLGEIAAHLQTNARQIFADDSFDAPVAPPPPQRSKLTDTVRETLHFFRQGKSVAEIAKIRGVVEGTIYGHLEIAIQAGEAIEVNSLVSTEAQREIAAAFKQRGFGSLGAVVEHLGSKYSYGQCRLVRAAMQMK